MFLRRGGDAGYIGSRVGPISLIFYDRVVLAKSSTSNLRSIVLDPFAFFAPWRLCVSLVFKPDVRVHVPGRHCRPSSVISRQAAKAQRTQKARRTMMEVTNTVDRSPRV